LSTTVGFRKYNKKSRIDNLKNLIAITKQHRSTTARRLQPKRKKHDFEKKFAYDEAVLTFQLSMMANVL